MTTTGSVRGPLVLSFASCAGLALVSATWSSPVHATTHARPEAPRPTVTADRLVASSIALAPDADATLYQEGDLSNGGGQFLFAGTTLRGQARRALVRFDVASALPPGSTIEDVRLVLTVDRTAAGDVTVAIHRLLSSWGEGSVDDDLREGDGAPAETGDATWDDRFHPTTAWTSAGGDFVATPSAGATAGGSGPVSFGSTASMIADVQGWLDDPSSNHGWIVIADETTAPTAKRFGSREGSVPADAPALFVELAPPAIPVWSGLGRWIAVALSAIAGLIVLRRVRGWL